MARLLRLYFGLFVLLLPRVLTAQTTTFYKDVLPVLQRHCQTCHRPGEIGPMPLLEYKQIRPWASAIRQAVLLRQMPPWFADPRYGHFSNDRSLSSDEIRTLARWAETGAVEGEPRDAPKPVHWVDGWSIGAPDIVFEMPSTVDVPRTGILPYRYVIVPTHFAGDTWVRMAEVRAGDRAHTHHIVVSIREPDSSWLREEPAGIPFTLRASDSGIPVDSKLVIDRRVRLVSLLPHMHLRGKSFEFRAVFPDGRAETLLSVPHYSYDWQLSYYLDTPLVLPAGTVIECTAHFDNLAGNARNPDPSKAVRFGPQSFDEMMIGYFEVAFAL